MSNSELNALLNLGPKSTGWLADIGVRTRQELEVKKQLQAEVEGFRFG